MFDFSFSEMLLAGVVALVVIGPERLPKAARTAGEWLGRLKRTAGSIKSELAQHGEYAELSKIKDELVQTADEIKQDLHEAGRQWQQESDSIRQNLEETLPAWDRLPEQRSPADFGIGDNHDYPAPTIGRLYGQSLKKQAMARRRDLRPRYRPQPRFRNRK